MRSADEVLIAVKQIQSVQNTIHERPVNNSQKYERILDQVIANSMDVHVLREQEHTQGLVQKLYKEAPGGSQARSLDLSGTSASNVLQLPPDQGHMPAEKRMDKAISNALQMKSLRFGTSNCKAWCECICHSRHRIRSRTSSVVFSARFCWYIQVTRSAFSIARKPNANNLHERPMWLTSSRHGFFLRVWYL